MTKLTKQEIEKERERFENEYRKYFITWNRSENGYFNPLIQFEWETRLAELQVKSAHYQISEKIH